MFFARRQARVPAWSSEPEQLGRLVLNEEIEVFLRDGQHDDHQDQHAEQPRGRHSAPRRNPAMPSETSTPATPMVISGRRKSRWGGEPLRPFTELNVVQSGLEETPPTVPTRRSAPTARDEPQPVRPHEPDRCPGLALPT